MKHSVGVRVAARTGQLAACFLCLMLAAHCRLVNPECAVSDPVCEPSLVLARAFLGPGGSTITINTLYRLNIQTQQIQALNAGTGALGFWPAMQPT